jgi:hypothetical protein
VKVDPISVKHIAHDGFLCYENINLSGITEIALSVTSAGSGGVVEIRMGSLKGEIIGKTIVTPNGSWEKYAEQVIKIKPIQFKGDLFVRFVKPGIEGGMMNLKYLAFR